MFINDYEHLALGTYFPGPVLPETTTILTAVAPMGSNGENGEDGAQQSNAAGSRQDTPGAGSDSPKAGTITDMSAGDEPAVPRSNGGFFRPSVTAATTAPETTSTLDSAIEHMRQVLAAFQEYQWVCQVSSPGIMTSLVGCSAGVPPAGIITIVALSRITRRIHARLEADGLELMLDTGETKATFDPGNAFG